MITGMSQEKKSRWEEFTVHELVSLRLGAIGRHNDQTVSADERERAGWLSTELRRELRARKQELSYRGAGIYRRWDGVLERVVGVAVLQCPSGEDQKIVIIKGPYQSPEHGLVAVTLEYFQGREGERRRYEFFEPAVDRCSP